MEQKNTPNQRSLTILVVEDNEVNRLMADLVLGNMGHLIQFAYNGQQCIDMFRDHAYDCIFMDIQMPVMDGLETTKYIRNTLKSEVPIIGVSANIYQEDIDKSLEAGMNDHIEKLYTENSIRLVLNKWINNSI